MYENELDAAIATAKRAAEATLKHYRGEIVTEQKIGADNFAEPVTEADREASRIVVESLASRFPEDGILSEEEHDDVELRLKRDRVWIVDPIDGTAGFIKRDGDFAIQIGLAERGRPVLGVVLLPFHQVIYLGARQMGSFVVNGDSEPRKLAVSRTSDISAVSLAVSRNHRSPKMSRVMEEIGFAREVQRGSVGLKIGLIAEQTCDAYIHLSSRTKLWDICAPQVILEEAGGRLTDLWGEEFSYDVSDVQNWGGIVATNGILHQETIERLRPILDDFGRIRMRQRTQ
ncbi:MAG TPA: 3'(2'),5'-bisphosphate nucleotidase CysQ [Pyrinomonadaceae bacterium]|nr:3'(2'),5'-bisphosphate nucleotidase CysQ [Pyrinomonadaceae bacterium]